MPLTPEQLEDIQSARSNPQSTLRAVAPGMEQHLYHAREVLDHGFVRVVDYMGDDAAIVQAARVSYGAGTKKARDDSGLIRYLMRHWHSTPFEMCELKLHVKLPVFVARQWIRHRTANVNEYSARYSILDREFYIPQPDALAAQSVVNNQGRGETLEGEEAERQRIRRDLHDDMGASIIRIIHAAEDPAVAPRGEAAVRMSSVTHEPQDPTPGEQVTTTAVVENDGDATARLRVVLQLDGRDIEEETIEVPAESARAVLFPWRAGRGSNKVRVQVYKA